jgi:hypothetical protein
MDEIERKELLDMMRDFSLSDYCFWSSLEILPD